MGDKPPHVIVGADPLLQSATGIGNYTRNLVKYLKSESLTADLKLFANGIFLSDGASSDFEPWEANLSSLSDGQNSDDRSQFAELLLTLRSRLSQNRIALKLFNKVVPLIEQSRLRPFRDYIFHSPNYLLPRFSGPTVVTIHDLSIQRYPEYHPSTRVEFLGAKIAQAAQSATHIITDSISVREEVIEYFGLDAARVTAIPLAAAEQFQPRTEDACRPVLQPLGLTYKRFFLFTSTIEPRKNLLRICAAYTAVREAGKTDWPIVFVGGPGWQSEAEHQAIQALVSRGWAQYLGFVDASVLPALYSAAGALVFPSVYEGFGLPALEAQQSGTRVITSRGSAMAEFSSEHDVLVDPLEVDSLIEAMETVVERVLVDAGRPLQCAGSGLSWQKTARLTAEVYQKVLAARH